MRTFSNFRKTACPFCGQGDFRRSRRHGVLERMLSNILGVYPYRCTECDRRFYARGPLLKEIVETSIGFPSPQVEQKTPFE